MDTHIPHEQYERARKYARKKRRLYWHFAVFLAGSVFIIILNTIFKWGESYGEWYVWAILLWFFLWVLHFLKVFVFSKFFDEEWERKETEKLIRRHEEKLEKLRSKLIEEGVISPGEDKKKENP